MKRLKKLLLIMMCVGILVSVTACAGNSNDNGAGQNDVVNDNGANDTQTGDSAWTKSVTAWKMELTMSEKA